MSEPKRYEPCNHRSYDDVMAPRENGKWVLYADYALLKAAFDLLDESIKLGPSTIPLSPGYYVWKESEHYDLKAENARLKAEVERLTLIVGADAIDREHGMCCDASAQVERLTKAGDAMAEELVRLEAAFNGIESAEAQIWYIAKEGGCP